jgi:hypothetical protein
MGSGFLVPSMVRTPEPSPQLLRLGPRLDLRRPRVFILAFGARSNLECKKSSGRGVCWHHGRALEVGRCAATGRRQL